MGLGTGLNEMPYPPLTLCILWLVLCMFMQYCGWEPFYATLG